MREWTGLFNVSFGSCLCLERDLFHFISFLVEWLVCWFSQFIHWYSFVAWRYFFVDHFSGMAMPHLIGFLERAVCKSRTGCKFIYRLRALWGTVYVKWQASVDRSSRPKPAWRLGARSICDLSDKCQVQMIALLATYSVLVTVWPVECVGIDSCAVIFAPLNLPRTVTVHFQA